MPSHPFWMVSSLGTGEIPSDGDSIDVSSRLASPVSKS